MINYFSRKSAIEKVIIITSLIMLSVNCILFSINFPSQHNLIITGIILILSGIFGLFFSNFIINKFFM